MRNLVEKYPRLFGFLFIKSDGKKVIIEKPFWVVAGICIFFFIFAVSKQDEVVNKVQQDMTVRKSSVNKEEIKRSLERFTKKSIPFDQIEVVEVENGIAVLVHDMWLFWIKDDVIYCVNGASKQVSPRNERNESVCKQAPINITYSEMRVLTHSKPRWFLRMRSNSKPTTVLSNT
jgi:GTP:adenosylcobinamide-phosphate guanylyltransferase